MTFLNHGLNVENFTLPKEIELWAAGACFSHTVDRASADRIQVPFQPVRLRRAGSRGWKRHTEKFSNVNWLKYSLWFSKFLHDSEISFNQSVLSGPSNQMALFRATLFIHLDKWLAVFLKTFMIFLGVIKNAEKFFEREFRKFVSNLTTGRF